MVQLLIEAPSLALLSSIARYNTTARLLLVWLLSVLQELVYHKHGMHSMLLVTVMYHTCIRRQNHVVHLGLCKLLCFYF